MLPDNRALWTFVIDFKEGTYVYQITALTLDDAISQYNKHDPSGMNAIPIGDGAVPKLGLKNVWGRGAVNSDDVGFTATIVKTVAD